jgi:N-acetylneuraminic acid mutarotase
MEKLFFFSRDMLSNLHMIKIDDMHATQLVRHLTDLYARRRFTDLKVRCGGEVFEMHASVVTCGSEYFRAMLEHAMVESGSNAFELHQLRPRVFERVVEWLYRGEVDEISDFREWLALLEGSRFLRVERLEAQCCAWLCAHVDASNCVAVWVEANRLGCSAVAEHALFVAGRNIASVAGNGQFLEVPLETLLELVRSDGLAVRSEQEVYKAVMGWVRHDMGSRAGCLGDVLGGVRLALLPTSYLLRLVGADALIMESPEALRIILSAVQLRQMRNGEHLAAETDVRLRQRKHATSGGLIVVVGGYACAGSCLRSAEFYNPLTQQWCALPMMRVARSGCAAVCVDGSVYVIGGWDGRSSQKSAEVYDGSAGQWRALPEMSAARNGCAAVCVEGDVYVMGGNESGHSDLKSAECFDTSTGQWRALPEMSMARSGCAAVCVEGDVYVIGGNNGSSQLNSVERYDPSARQWWALPEMSVARFGCAAACVEGNVYVVGGHDGHCCLKTAECYDTSTGQWHALPQMSVARCGCTAVCVEGNVYVAGGYDGAIKHSNAECYDPVANEWRTVPSMNTSRWFGGAAAAELGRE